MAQNTDGPEFVVVMLQVDMHYYCMDTSLHL